MAKGGSSRRTGRYTPPAAEKGFSGFWSRLSDRQKGQFVMASGSSIVLILFLVVRALFF